MEKIPISDLTIKLKQKRYSWLFGRNRYHFLILIRFLLSKFLRIWYQIFLEEIRICGKCCESGDVLIDSVKMPVCKSGDIIAVMSTGAYCYSMSSEYNKLLKPAMVMVNEGNSRLIIKREKYEDLIRSEGLK